MNILVRLLAQINSIPARIKGMRFGKDSYIGPGYDCINVHLKGVILGNRVIVGKNAWMQTVQNNATYPTISIGDNSQIGRNVTISSVKKITIGKNCLISYNVTISDHEHNFYRRNNSPLTSGLSKGEEVVIGEESFIGAHSFILKGVHLGKHCVVGANSVVTRSFSPYSVIGGNPAKLIKRIK